MVILGGLGSLTGVVLGAIVINVSFEILAPENPQTTRALLFYGADRRSLLVWHVRPWWRLGAVLAGAVALGFAVHARRRARSAPRGRGGAVVEGGRLGRRDRRLGAHPARATTEFGNVAYVALVVAASWR